MNCKILPLPCKVSIVTFPEAEHQSSGAGSGSYGEHLAVPRSEMGTPGPWAGASFTFPCSCCTHYLPNLLVAPQPAQVSWTELLSPHSWCPKSDPPFPNPCASTQTPGPLNPAQRLWEAPGQLQAVGSLFSYSHPITRQASMNLPGSLVPQVKRGLWPPAPHRYGASGKCTDTHMSYFQEPQGRLWPGQVLQGTPVACRVWSPVFPSAQLCRAADLSFGKHVAAY